MTHPSFGALSTLKTVSISTKLLLLLFFDPFRSFFAVLPEFSNFFVLFSPRFLLPATGTRSSWGLSYLNTRRGRFECKVIMCRLWRKCFFDFIVKFLLSILDDMTHRRLNPANIFFFLRVLDLRRNFRLIFFRCKKRPLGFWILFPDFVSLLLFDWFLKPVVPWPWLVDLFQASVKISDDVCETLRETRIGPCSKASDVDSNPSVIEIVEKLF